SGLTAASKDSASPCAKAPSWRSDVMTAFGPPNFIFAMSYLSSAADAVAPRRSGEASERPSQPAQTMSTSAPSVTAGEHNRPIGDLLSVDTAPFSRSGSSSESDSLGVSSPLVERRAASLSHKGSA